MYMYDSKKNDIHIWVGCAEINCQIKFLENVKLILLIFFVKIKMFVDLQTSTKFVDFVDF